MADRKPVPLDVVGRVMIEMGGDSARIEARGDRIVVELPGFRAGASTLRSWTKAGGRREAVRRIHQSLVDVGLTLEVVVAGATVGLLGVDARPTLISRLLGFDPLEIRVGGVFGSLKGRTNRPE